MKTTLPSEEKYACTKLSTDPVIQHNLPRKQLFVPSLICNVKFVTFMKVMSIGLICCFGLLSLHSMVIEI